MCNEIQACTSFKPVLSGKNQPNMERFSDWLEVTNYIVNYELVPVLITDYGQG